MVPDIYMARVTAKDGSREVTVDPLAFARLQVAL